MVRKTNIFYHCFIIDLIIVFDLKRNNNPFFPLENIHFVVFLFLDSSNSYYIMQVIKENDGILTNIEVLSLLKSRKESRKQHRDELSKNSATFYSNKIDLQNRTFVENKVSDYIKITKPSKWSLTLMHACLREIKLLQLPITENEFIHIANHLPETDVEFYLVNFFLFSLF